MRPSAPSHPCFAHGARREAGSQRDRRGGADKGVRRFPVRKRHAQPGPRCPTGAGRARPERRSANRLVQAHPGGRVGERRQLRPPLPRTARSPWRGAPPSSMAWDRPECPRDAAHVARPDGRGRHPEVAQVEAAVRRLANEHHLIVEGAGAAAFAAALKCGIPGAVALVSGGNLDPKELARILMS